MSYTSTVSLSDDLIDDWKAIPRMERSALVQRLLREEFSGSTAKVKKKVNKLVINSKAVVKQPTGKIDKRNPDIDDVLAYWAQATGLPINSKVPLNRANAKTLLNRRSLSQVKQLIDGAALANMDKYSGLRISNIIELQMSESKLILWGRNQTNEPQKERSVKL